MTAPTGERLLTDYLARLESAALPLPPDRRAELLEGIAEHVAAARDAGELYDEAAVRTLLDRLGEPEEIVAAAGEGGPAGEPSGAWGGPPRWNTPEPALVPSPPGTGLEIAAVVMLTAGSLVPVVGWLVGVALLWSSRRWRTREKLLGTLVVPGGPGILLPLSFFAGFQTSSCSVSTVVSTPPSMVPGPGAPPPDALPPPPVFMPPPVVETSACGDPLLPTPVVIALVVIALVAPFVVAALLLRRARARAAAEPPMLRRAGGSGWGGLETAAVLILAFGSFVVPFVGSLVGLVMVWSSRRWSNLEKGVATVLTLLPAGVVLLALLEGPVVLPFGLFAVAVIALFGQLFAAGYLALVLNRRRATQPG